MRHRQLLKVSSLEMMKGSSADGSMPLQRSIPQNVCLFCASHLSVELHAASLSRTRRPFTQISLKQFNLSSRKRHSDASAAAVGNNGPKTDDAVFVFNPDSSLSLLEQQEKFQRVQAAKQREAMIRERRALDEAQRREAEEKQRAEAEEKQRAEAEERRRAREALNAERHGNERRRTARDSSSQSNAGTRGRGPREPGHLQQSTSTSNVQGSANAQSAQNRPFFITRTHSANASRPLVIGQSQVEGQSKERRRSKEKQQPKGKQAPLKATHRSQPRLNKLSTPIFGRQADKSAEDAPVQAVSGWGLGSTETAPLQYGEGRSAVPPAEYEQVGAVSYQPFAQLPQDVEIGPEAARQEEATTLNVTASQKASSETIEQSAFHSSVVDQGDCTSSAQPEDNSSRWQHLRPKREATDPPHMQVVPEPDTTVLADTASIDRDFEEHRVSRTARFQPLRPARRLENDDDPLRLMRTKARCARCGQLGHVARNCSLQSTMPRSHEQSRSKGFLDEPFGAAASIRERGSGRFEYDGERRPTENFEARGVRGSDRMSDDAHGDRIRRLQAANEDDEPREKKFEARDRRDVDDGEEPPRKGRMSRRDEWDDDDQPAERASGRRGNDRKSRVFDDEDDDHAAAREEARARKAARQAERAEKKAAEQAAARAEREARKAAQATVINLPEFVSVQNLAQALGVRYDRFVNRLEELGYDDIFPGKVLNAEISGLIAMEYNFEPNFDAGVHEDENRDLKAAPPAPPEQAVPRPPVVTIMGHVDHGKTTILDYIRKSSVAAGEAGGITQHIGAFSVPMTSSGKLVTFLDTPGHEAFLAMRQRGANVTDIVVLVVAGDDSVKPQTIEAIKHAKAAGVPMIVAINKIDKEEADIERCKQDLARHGIEIEDYGGDTQVVPLSGKTGKGMDELEENIVTLSEILDHRADPEGNVEGWVIEATTKLSGRVATVLVRRGTLRPGDIIVAGKTWARVRTLKNEGGEELEEVGPGMPVEVDGWDEQPVAGDEVLQALNEQVATKVVDYRIEKEERVRAAKDTEVINDVRRRHQIRRDQEKEQKYMDALRRKDEYKARMQGEELGAIASTAKTDSVEEQSGQISVPFIIKADVSGSVEAVEAYVLGVSNPLITPKILSSGVGAINESDITLAAAAKGHIIAFNLPQNNDARAAAEAEGIKILENNIIYRVLDDVKAVLEEVLPPVVTQKVTGEAEISAVFDINVKSKKFVKIAGCKVRNGVVGKGSHVRVVRHGEKVYDGMLQPQKCDDNVC